MTRKRKQYSPAFKAKVGTEALKGLKTTAQLSSSFGVHSSQISKWKKHLQDNLPTLFEQGTHALSKVDQEMLDQEKAPLLQEIGSLTVQLKWLKKKLDVAD